MVQPLLRRAVAIPLMVDGERSEGPGALSFSLDTFDCHLLGLDDGR